MRGKLAVMLTIPFIPLTVNVNIDDAWRDPSSLRIDHILVTVSGGADTLGLDNVGDQALAENNVDFPEDLVSLLATGPDSRIPNSDARCVVWAVPAVRLRTRRESEWGSDARCRRSALSKRLLEFPNGESRACGWRSVPLGWQRPRWVGGHRRELEEQQERQGDGDDGVERAPLAACAAAVGRAAGKDAA